MRCAEYVTHSGELRNSYKILFRKQGKYHSGDLDLGEEKNFTSDLFERE
jgi:hypothetical protein